MSTVRISERINSFKVSIREWATCERTQRVTKIALHVLDASESSIGSFIIQNVRAVNIGMNLGAIIDGQSTKEHVKEAAFNILLITVDIFAHPLCVIVMHGLEIVGECSNLFGEVRALNPHLILTIGNIAAEIFVLYSKLAPSTEMIVLAAVIRIAKDLGNSMNAFYNKQHIEGYGYLAAAVVHAFVKQDDFFLMHYKWTFLSDPKFQKIWDRIHEGLATA